MLTNRWTSNIYYTLIILVCYLGFLGGVSIQFFVLFTVFFIFLLAVWNEHTKSGIKNTVPSQNERTPNNMDEIRELERKIEIIERSYQTRFSYILETEARLCCHQTARLSERYCICGRALDYPNLTETIIASA